MPKLPHLVPALALSVAALACGSGGESSDEVAADTGRVWEAGTVQQVDSATLALLSERYPVLRAEPAPEPQPSSSASREIPPELRDSVPRRVLQSVRGEATFYSDVFEGRRTASGIPFRQNQMVAAHRGYPFGTVLRVTNLRNDRSVQVRVVDRGPWGAKAEARNTIIDLSTRAARQLGYIQAGRTPVRVEVLEWGPGVRGSV